MNITLQNVFLPEEDCGTTELFYRVKGETSREKGSLIMKTGGRIKTNTYMNLLDEAAWGQYTNLEQWELRIRVRGKGKIRVLGWSEDGEDLLFETEIFSTQVIERIFRGKFQKRKIYFEMIADDELELYGARYSGIIKDKVRNIHMSLIICTYHRKEAVLKNCEKIRKSAFFDPLSEYYDGLNLKIIDNGSELKKSEEKNIEVIHNSNTGGSGGFSRGILESRRDEEKYGITHIILMDDDVEIIEETLYRLYSLLRLIKEEYSESVVGGRMFRLDRKEVQYTASEIWNGGNIIHIGENHDMTRWENLCDMNGESGEYTGWWFACFTMDFARENLPLPFFLHCDDVEYGLRHGGTPIILNGIQVWHETYEYRKSIRIEYYDTRNSLIVNTLRNVSAEPKDVWESCRKRLDDHWNKKEYSMAYAACIGLWDYLKGIRYFLNTGEKIKKIKIPFLSGCRLTAAVIWRIVYVKYKLCGKKAFESYKEIKEHH